MAVAAIKAHPLGGKQKFEGDIRVTRSESDVSRLNYSHLIILY